MKPLTKIGFGTAIPVVTLGLLAWHVASPRTLGRVTAPDGTEFCVVQECNWSPEPFTTSIFYRKPGRPWGWFYYDHQDWYWHGAQISIDSTAQKILVARADRPTANFFWQTESFYYEHEGKIGNMNQGAQEWMPPSFQPDQPRRTRQ